MSDELELRLRRAMAPQIQHDAAVWAAARSATLDAVPARRRPSRRALRFIAPAAGFAAAAGLLVVALPRGQQEEPSSTGQLSVLNRPQTPVDRLPAWVRRDPILSSYRIDPATSRLARRVGQRAYYVARTRAPVRPSVGLRTAPGWVCLIDVLTGPLTRIAKAGNPGGVNCQDPEVLVNHFLISNLVPMLSEGRSWPRAGIAPDGLDRAVAGDSTDTVVNNVWVLDDAGDGNRVSLSGSGGVRSQPVVSPLPARQEAEQANPGGALRVTTSSSPSGPRGRWGFEPGVIEIRGAVRRGYTTAKVLDLTAPIGVDRRFVFHRVRIADTTPVTVTGPSGSATVWVTPMLGYQVRVTLKGRR